MKEILPVNWEQENSIIKVIGVGGGGGNAVNQMFKQGIKDVTFAVCNTDTQALNSSPIPLKIQLGSSLTRGLGAGCNPTQGRNAALESIDSIKEMLGPPTEMVFITAGMGGGTGTGAAPVIAKVAKDMGILTVGVVTLPFRDEGNEFLKRAVLGIRELEKCVDSLLIIDNQKLYKIYGELSVYEAFPKADGVLNIAVKSIAEIITKPGYINVDFADVKMVMSNSGMAIMGTGTASGENRAVRAVEEAISSPLLNDFDLKTAKSVLVNISSSREFGLSMAELSQIMDYISQCTGGYAINFKRGVVCDNDLGESVSVTIVATGFSMHTLPQVSADGGQIIESVVLNPDDMQEPGVQPQSAPTPRVTGDHYPEKQSTTPKAPQIKRETPPVSKPASAPASKPALIVEPGQSLTNLENVPAYIRREMKKSGTAPQTGEDLQDQPQQPTNVYKIEEIQGKQFLSPDNSYLHKKQD